MTARLDTHALWDDDAPYSIKRYGTTITNCDAEPVQTPGCIQAHGVLLVARGDARTSIAQVSENLEHLLGLAPEAALDRPLADVVGATAAQLVRDALAGESLENNPRYVTTLPARADHGGAALDVSVHTSRGAIVIELEPTDRHDDRDVDYYALVKTAVARLQGATSLDAFCDVVAREFRALTGFDRAMVYRFHADHHGEVVAEDKHDDLPSWLGLHYPAEDIPAPAREIFKRTWTRPVCDVAAPLAELVPLAHPDTGKPLTMTHCALRGPSLMYTEYLQNMRVTAAFTVSIRQDDRLWGLIACHHYAGPHAVPHQVRAAAEFLGQVTSLQLKSIEDRGQLLQRLELEAVHNAAIARAAHRPHLLTKQSFWEPFAV